MGYAGIATTHGMRATFRTWASETTDYDKDVIEAAWPTPRRTRRGLSPGLLSRQAPPPDGRLGELLYWRRCAAKDGRGVSRLKSGPWLGQGADQCQTRKGVRQMSSTKYKVRGPSLAVFFLRLLQAGLSRLRNESPFGSPDQGRRHYHQAVPACVMAPATDGFRRFHDPKRRTATSTPKNSSTTGRGSLPGSKYLSACKSRQPKSNT